MRLFELLLGRQMFGAEQCGPARKRIFTPGSVVLAGTWDVLRIVPIPLPTARKSLPPISTSPQKERLGGLGAEEQRIVYGVGPVHATEDVGDLEGVSRRFPLAAYVEIRLADYPLMKGGRRALEAAAAVVRQRLQDPSLEGSAYALFYGLGHMDLLLVYFSSSLHLISEMLFAMRSLRVASLLDAGDLVSAEAVGEHAAEALCQTTHTSFGFFCSSFDQLDSLPARLTYPGECRVFPTVLCGLRPGIEADPARLRHLLLPEGALGRLEIISGMFDVRLSYDNTLREQRPTERSVFEWAIGIYKKLFSEEGAVRTVHTSWGYDAAIPPVSARGERAPASMAPVASTPSSPRMTEPLKVTLSPGDVSTIKEVLGRRWPFFDEVITYYNSLVTSPIFARYLADVGQFLCVLRDELTSERLPEDEIVPGDIELILRRVTMIIVGRIAGATPSGEKEVVLGRAVGQQKILMAFSFLSQAVGDALGSARSHARLIGLTAIGEPRTTRVYWPDTGRPARRRNSLVVIELPAVGDVWSILFPLVHEIGHTCDLNAQQRNKVWEMLAEELSAEVYRAVFGQSALKTEELRPILELVRHRLGLPRPSSSDAFRRAVDELLRTRGIRELLSDLGSGRLGLPKSSPMLFSFQASDLDALSEALGTCWSSVQSLNSECRADIIAAELCGTARYRRFLEELSGARSPALHGLKRERIEILNEIHARLDGSESLTPSMQRPVPGKHLALLHWLEDFAREIRERIHSKKEHFQKLRQLVREMENSNGGLDQAVTETLLNLWGDGLGLSLQARA